LTATSAQPCDAVAGEEIVHESAKAGAKAPRLGFFDTLIRTAGQTPGVLTDTTSLFTSNGARTEATTNLINGSTLPSDQSHVTLALRVFSWYRNPILRIAGGAPGEVATTGDFDTFAPWLVGGPAIGQAAGTVQDVYRLHSQTEEQLHWTFGTGLKPALENMPTWYFNDTGARAA
jgi:hypothetical protein